ncbi:hypothetical protein V5O48_017006 [Marasmius crinis-equi]|uniref:Uncharacterized protein n=1 Tax=Marasmius crinis-equi TaxID=585013 RepID=A0ABR3EQ60_9AGAR
MAISTSSLWTSLSLTCYADGFLTGPTTLHNLLTLFLQRCNGAPLHLLITIDQPPPLQMDDGEDHPDSNLFSRSEDFDPLLRVILNDSSP